MHSLKFVVIYFSHNIWLVISMSVLQCSADSDRPSPLLFQHFVAKLWVKICQFLYSVDFSQLPGRLHNCNKG